MRNDKEKVGYDRKEVRGKKLCERKRYMPRKLEDELLEREVLKIGELHRYKRARED